MTEVIESQGDSFKDNVEVHSLSSHHSHGSSNGKFSYSEDHVTGEVAAQENSDTSSELTSPPTDSARDRGSTITKKIPLSEYATLQGILAHQVDEGAPCLKCGPDVCAGLDLHFWKKVCKNCGCPRGSHKIQKLIEEKKEVPRSILLQTADEDEEDYKELEIAAPPTKTTIKGKSDSQDCNKYNEEYIAKLREFYKHKTALNLPEDKKLSSEQLLILQQYINQTQGQEVVSPEVLQNHLHLLAKTSAGSSDHLDVSDNDLHRTHSSASVTSDSSDLPVHFLQALQLVQINKDSTVRSDSPGEEHEILQDPTENAAMPRYTPASEERSYDSQVNEEEENATKSSNKKKMNIPSRRKHHEDSTIEMIDRLTDVSRLNNTETAMLTTSPIKTPPMEGEDVSDDAMLYEGLPSVAEESDSDLFSDIPVDSREDDRHLPPATSSDSLSTSSEDPNLPYPPGLNTYKGKQQRRFTKRKDPKDQRRYKRYSVEESTSELDEKTMSGRSLRSYNEYEPSYSSYDGDRVDWERFRKENKHSNVRSAVNSHRSFNTTRPPSRPVSHSQSLRSRHSPSNYHHPDWVPRRTGSMGRVDHTLNIYTKNRNYREGEEEEEEEDGEEEYSDHTSEDENQHSAPPKPLRRNPGSFDDLTQGDIVDYYTMVSPSGDLPQGGSSTLQRKGSPGVWVPPGIDHSLVKQYLAALPEDKRPVNTLGVQWRIKQLQTQLPRYDHNINYCHEMSPEEQEELFMFVESRKEKAQGQGEVKSFKKKNKKKCEKCGGLVDCSVIADKVPGRVWHPGCFACTTCDEILVDLIYFQYDGRLYCGRHHAELLRPRCHACDELIFGQEFITADKHEYHKEHFCCWECDASLGGAKYVSHKGQPYCQGCYEKLFCTRCVTCREPIGTGAPLYKHGPLRWHGNPQCYACSFCKTSLVNRTFMPTERYVYCSKNCYRCHESLRKTKGKQ